MYKKNLIFFNNLHPTPNATHFCRKSHITSSFFSMLTSPAISSSLNIFCKQHWNSLLKQGGLYDSNFYIACHPISHHLSSYRQGKLHHQSPFFSARAIECILCHDKGRQYVQLSLTVLLISGKPSLREQTS